ncbi:MAG: hypothetical protein H0X73_08150 [Chthoniobacterales bacterium]|nr:hypothetical protein [Chthoniobacterales bacterium]
MRRSPTPPPAGQQVSKKFHLWLDEPLDWNLKVRRLRLSGWCVAKDGAPRTRVRGQIGAATFYGQFDRDRPDVVQFLNVPEALRWCGFAVDVVVPFGRKRLELEVATADGEWQKAYARTVVGPLRIGPAERELWQKSMKRTRNGATPSSSAGLTTGTSLLDCCE